MKSITINGITETIIERSDYPRQRIDKILNGEPIAILGYGPQGRGQGLNLKDQGYKVLIGLRKGRSWEKALADGWKEGVDLFSLEEASKRGSVIQYLLSDAAQISMWPTIKPFLKKGKTLYFSHGFGIVFREQTNIIPPPDIDVILVAPKGSGLTVRTQFQEGRGINASYAVFQDATGHAAELAQALGIAIGSGHLFKTTFDREVHSDLTGERCVLMGMIQGAFLAQYEVLRENGHSPSEAYNETIEEALCSLYPLIAEKGMDWMYANCSTTAQRGALDWAPRFKQAIKPVVESCYQSVRSGEEARLSISSNSASDYREKLEVELKAIKNQEMWQAGKVLRAFRPENTKI